VLGIYKYFTKYILITWFVLNKDIRLLYTFHDITYVSADIIRTILAASKIFL